MTFPKCTFAKKIQHHYNERENFAKTKEGEYTMLLNKDQHTPILFEEKK